MQQHMEVPVDIEPFDMTDYDRVYSLWERTEGVGLSPADSRENISEYLTRNPGMSFVCRNGERIVGTVLGGHDGRRGYIHHLAVSEEFRKGGIGSELLKACMDSLGRSGIAKCHLFVFGDNDAGKRFWERRGWQERGDLVVFSQELG